MRLPVDETVLVRQRCEFLSVSDYSSRVAQEPIQFTCANQHEGHRVRMALRPGERHGLVELSASALRKAKEPMTPGFEHEIQHTQLEAVDVGCDAVSSGIVGCHRVLDASHRLSEAANVEEGPGLHVVRNCLDGGVVGFTRQSM